MATEQRRETGGTNGLLSGRSRGLVVGLVVLVATAAFSRLGVSTALPSATAELGGQALYGAVLSTFTVANIFGLCLAGPTFDRFGVVRPLSIGVALFAVGLLVATVAPVMPVLISGRALQGVGAGALAVASYTAIARGIPAEQRPAMLAVNASAFTVPSMVGPVLAGALADTTSWRVVFALLIPLAPLALLIARVPLLRIDSERAPAPTDTSRSALPWTTVIGCAVFAAGVVVVQITPGVGGAASWIVLAIGLAGALFGLSRLLPAGTLRMRRGLPANMIFAVALSLAFFTTDLYLPLALTDLRGASASVAGLALTAGVVGWTGGAYIPAVTRRVGLTRRALGMLGATLVMVGIAGIVLTILLELPFPLVIVSWVIAGCGAGIGFTSNAAAVLDRAGGEPGAASSQMEIGNQAGIAIGTGVGGVAIAAGGIGSSTVTQTLLLAAAGGVIAVVAAFRFDSAKR